MTAAIVIGALTLAAIAYIVAPIGRRARRIEEATPETAPEERKRVALTGILDLEEERDGGKLSDTEFADLRARYERDAIEALNDLDDRSPRGDVDDRLEREIASAREKLRCGTCGAPRGIEATRCPSCGSSY